MSASPTALGARLGEMIRMLASCAVQGVCLAYRVEIVSGSGMAPGWEVRMRTLLAVCWHACCDECRIVFVAVCRVGCAAAGAVGAGVACVAYVHANAKGHKGKNTLHVRNASLVLVAL